MALKDLEFEIDKLRRVEKFDELTSNKQSTIPDRVWMDEKKAHENTKWKLIQAEKSLALSSKKISELESAIEELSEAFLEWKVSSNMTITSDVLQQKVLSLEAERDRLLNLHNDDLMRIERLDSSYKRLQSDYSSKERELKESVDYLSATIPEFGSLKANNRIQKLKIQEMSQLIAAKNEEIARLHQEIQKAYTDNATEHKQHDSVDGNKIQMVSDKNAESELMIQNLEEKLAAFAMENKHLTSVAFEKELIHEQNRKDLEVRLLSSNESQAFLKGELETLEKKHASVLSSLYLLSNSLQSTRAKFFNVLSPLDFEIVDTADFEKLSQVVQIEASDLVSVCLDRERECNNLRASNEKLELLNSTSNEKLRKANSKISALRQEVQDLHQEFLSILNKKKTALDDNYHKTKKELEDTLTKKSKAEDEATRLHSELNEMVEANEKLNQQLRLLEDELVMKSKSHLEQLEHERQKHQDVIMQKQEEYERLSVAFDSLNEMHDRALEIQHKTRAFAIKKSQRFSLHQHLIFWFHFTWRLAQINHVKDKMSFYYSMHYKAGFFKHWKSHSKFLCHSRRLIDKLESIHFTSTKAFVFKMFWVITEQEKARYQLTASSPPALF